MSRWFRLHDCVLDDPKVQRLSPALFKTWINLLCLASRNDGVLPGISDIAFIIRMDEEAANSAVIALIDGGLLDMEGGGEISPHKWAERQFKGDSSTDRVKRFRERSMKRDETVSTSDVKRDETVSETASDTDTEQNRGRESALAGPLSPKPSVSGSKKGSRVPIGFRPNPVDLAEANRLIGTRVEIEILKFRDYWGARAGKDGLKLDWDATWRNWARRASEAPLRPGAGHPAAGTYKSPVVDRLAGLVWVEEGSPDWLAWMRTRPGYVASQLQERSENGKALVGAYLPSTRPEMQGAAA